MSASTQQAVETTFNLRIDADLKDKFAAAAEAEDLSAAEALRGLMRGYVDQAAKRRFAAEARRQSKLVAASRDEAEVMRWIQDVTAAEEGR